VFRGQTGRGHRDIDSASGGSIRSCFDMTSAINCAGRNTYQGWRTADLSSGLGKAGALDVRQFRYALRSAIEACAATINDVTNYLT
jgi:hypothetical protein